MLLQAPIMGAERRAPYRFLRSHERPRKCGAKSQAEGPVSEREKHLRQQHDQLYSRLQSAYRLSPGYFLNCFRTRRLCSNHLQLSGQISTGAPQVNEQTYQSRGGGTRYPRRVAKINAPKASGPSFQYAIPLHATSCAFGDWF